MKPLIRWFILAMTLMFSFTLKAAPAINFVDCDYGVFDTAKPIVTMVGDSVVVNTKPRMRSTVNLAVMPKILASYLKPNSDGFKIAGNKLPNQRVLQHAGVVAA